MEADPLNRARCVITHKRLDKYVRLSVSMAKTQWSAAQFAATRMTVQR
jgi:hypothetical protein